MNEKEQQKQKIRERYKGADTGRSEKIPAKEQPGFYANVKRRVAVYVRVSTDNVEQTSSYELQKNYYEDLVGKNPDWTLVGIYADEGISGTSLKHRDAFNRMIQDCVDGKIDMIITKSGSRFTRNVADYNDTIQKLDSLDNPVGVYFESEGMYSLKSENEMTLNFIIAMAQEESRIKSSVMNSSIEMRFSQGILLTPVLLGYDHDEDGHLVINEDEAQTVKLIFYKYLLGNNCEQIAAELTRLGRLTKKGNEKWSSSTVLNVLRNERYCGDVLARKTFTPNYKDHKSKKNRGNKNRYRWFDRHEPIISRGDFIAVQHLLDNEKYQNKHILPELKVITEGVLSGFASINPRWSAFTVEDYIDISERALGNIDDLDKLRIQAEKGDFDFRGYEIVSSQILNISDRICVTFTLEKVVFGIGALRKLNNCKYVEMLIHPKSGLFAVRPCAADNKNAMNWLRMNNLGSYVPKNVGGKAFLKTLFELLGWKDHYKYRSCGFLLKRGDELLLMFDLNKSDVLIPCCDLNMESLNGKFLTPYAGKKHICALNSNSADSFGDNFYQQSLFEKQQDGKISGSAETVSFSELRELDITSSEEVKDKINELVNIMEDENQ